MNELDNQRNNNADQYHGGDRKIETEILLFNADIARQVPHPTEFIACKVNHNTCHHRQNSDDNQYFSNVLHIFNRV